MKKTTSLWLLAILLFLSACSSSQPHKQMNYQEEAKEGEHLYNHRPSIRMQEEDEEYFEQEKKPK